MTDAIRDRRALVLLAAVLLFLGSIVSQAFVSPTLVEASHLRSTQLTWRTTAPNTAEFTATIATRRSYFSDPNVGDTINEPTIDYGDGNSEDPDFTVTFVDPVNDFLIATTTVSHAYASAGPFTAVLEICCRLSTPQHINNPDANNRAETLVNFAATSASPVSSISPIIDCPLESVCSFFIPAIDADAQPLSFRLSTGPEATGTTFVQPGPPQAPNAAAIDAGTGLFTWNTAGATLNDGSNPDLTDTFYSVQVMVENVVNQAVVAKTPVDFFIRLRSGSTNQAPTFIAPTPADGSVLDATVGVLFTCAVAASDPDTADTVTLAMIGKPADATYATVNGNPATGLFEWTPAATGSVIVTLVATDPHGSGATPRSLTINVSAAGAVATPVLCPSATATPTPTPTPSPTPRGSVLGGTSLPNTASAEQASAWVPISLAALALIGSAVALAAGHSRRRHQVDRR